MKIKNFDELAASDSRRAALMIAEAGLRAIDTGSVLRASVKLNGDELFVKNEKFLLESGKRIFVVAVGKCAIEAAAALEDILGDRLSDGVAVDTKTSQTLKKIKAFQGTHPLPTEANVKAAKAVVQALSGLRNDDLVIFAISGGGSTLLCLPEDGEYKDEAKIVGALIRSGATIQEINTVRKHLSLARGGYLAKYAYPAEAISLIFSDVPGNNLEFVSSGPTLKDHTTIKEAEVILAKYDVLKSCGIEKCDLVETPKEEKYFVRVKNILAVSNEDALAAMEAKAKELGFAAKICTACLNGEAREVGLALTKDLHKAGPKTAFLYGGETTVTVRGHGKGGRNLELALSALREIQDDELIMTIASDGADNGPFAGAICDRITKKAIGDKNLDYKAALDENNAYPFFEKIGNYILTGGTGSNVSDLVIALKE